jgi:hypothetical protein
VTEPEPPALARAPLPDDESEAENEASAYSEGPLGLSPALVTTTSAAADAVGPQAQMVACVNPPGRPAEPATAAAPVGSPFAPGLIIPSSIVVTLFLYPTRGANVTSWLAIGASASLCVALVEARDDARVAGWRAALPSVLVALAVAPLFLAAVFPIASIGTTTSWFSATITVVFLVQAVVALRRGAAIERALPMRSETTGVAYREAGEPAIDREAYTRERVGTVGGALGLAVLAAGAVFALSRFTALGGYVGASTAALAALAVLGASQIPWNKPPPRDVVRGGRLMWLVVWAGYVACAVTYLDAVAALACVPFAALVAFRGYREARRSVAVSNGGPA